MNFEPTVFLLLVDSSVRGTQDFSFFYASCFRNKIANITKQINKVELLQSHAHPCQRRQLKEQSPFSSALQFQAQPENAHFKSVSAPLGSNSRQR